MTVVWINHFGVPGRAWRWRRRVAAAEAAGLLAAGLVAAAAGPAAAPSPPALAFTPSPYSSGQVTLGRTASQTYIKTAGTCTGTSLGKGKPCTVTVQFAPASAETVTATLTATAKKATATDSLTGAVTKTTPTLTTRPGRCVVPKGSPPFPCDAEDSASLTGVARPPSGVVAGTLKFTLYGPSANPDCSGKPAFPAQSEVVELSSKGGFFVAVPVSGAGTYWWVVSYTGDANNKPVTSRCGAESTTA
jgi:hypothetical protein